MGWCHGTRVAHSVIIPSNECVKEGDYCDGPPWARPHCCEGLICVSSPTPVIACHCEGRGWKFWGDTPISTQNLFTGLPTAEKKRLEKRQRMSRKIQESGWKARWFKREGEDGPFHYMGGYWEAREKGKWDECPNIFGEIHEPTSSSSSSSHLLLKKT
ncbi:hypothetical protein CsatB_002154 [Cannabis sativa]